MKSLSGSRTDADNSNQYGMTPLSVLFERGFLHIEWWHTDTSFNASCSCDGSWSLCNHRQVTRISPSPVRRSILRFLCRHALPLQIFVYVPVDNKHCASYVLPSTMTKQSNFEDVLFGLPERAYQTWLVQRTLRGMKVATPSFNWIPLSSTLGHGVVVASSTSSM